MTKMRLNERKVKNLLNFSEREHFRPKVKASEIPNLFEYFRAAAYLKAPEGGLKVRLSERKSKFICVFSEREYLKRDKVSLKIG